MDAPSGSWPLSAAATAHLRTPKIDANDVMKLALKELVLRRAWRLERLEGQGWRGKGTKLLLRPGDRPVPPLAPLPAADAALRAAVERGNGDVRTTVKRMLKANGKLPDQLRDDARQELASRGLVEIDRRRILGVFPRTVVVPTLSGRSWIEDIGGREASLRAAAGRTGAELAPQVAALGGLVLLLEPETLTELDGIIHRLRDTSGDAAVAGGGGSADADDEPGVELGGLEDVGSLDVADLGSLDAIDSGFDSAVDAGVSDGGGGNGGGDGGGS